MVVVTVQGAPLLLQYLLQSAVHESGPWVRTVGSPEAGLAGEINRLPVCPI